MAKLLSCHVASRHTSKVTFSDEFATNYRTTGNDFQMSCDLQCGGLLCQRKTGSRYNTSQYSSIFQKSQNHSGRPQIRLRTHEIHYRLLARASYTLIARFMGPTWVLPGAERTQVGPMLAPWTLPFGIVCQLWVYCKDKLPLFLASTRGW